MPVLARVRRHLPILKWGPKYRLENFRGDLIAGLTVGLMVVPQGLAYAHLARLPYDYGLYSAFMGVFVYTFLGTAKDITVGPTAIMSLLVAAAANGDVTKAVALPMMAGVVQVALGVLQLGVLVDYISRPVLFGFTSAASITIAFSQVKHVLGLKNVRRPFTEAVHDVFTSLEETNGWDLLMGLACVVVVLGLKELKTRKGDESKVAWALGTGRNALVVILAGLAAFALCDADGDTSDCAAHSKISIIGTLPAGLPKPTAPTFYSDLIGDAVVVAAIGLLESVSIAKVFAKMNGYEIDVEQEMIALGGANIVSSFFKSYPVTGSFSRTAVNSQSGVNTPLAGMFTGSVVMAALLFLTKYFYFIPDAALAAIIICAVLTMFEYPIFVELWKTNKLDFLVLLVAFCGCLLIDIKTGVMAAVGAQVALMLYKTARPKWVELGVVELSPKRGDGTASPLREGVRRRGASSPAHGASAHDDVSGMGRSGVTTDLASFSDVRYVPVDSGRPDIRLPPAGIVVLRVYGPLFGAAAGHVSEALTRLEADHVDNGDPVRAWVIDFSCVSNIDSTGAHMLSEFVADRRLHRVRVHFCAIPMHVHRDLSMCGVLGGVDGGEGRVDGTDNKARGSHGGHGGGVAASVPAQCIHETVEDGVAAADAVLRKHSSAILGFLARERDVEDNMGSPELRDVVSGSRDDDDDDDSSMLARGGRAASADPMSRAARSDSMRTGSGVASGELELGRDGSVNSAAQV